MCMNNIVTLFLALILIVMAGGSYLLLTTPRTNTIIEVPTVASSSPTLINSVLFACQGDRTVKADFYTNAPTSTVVVAGAAPTPTGSVRLDLSDGRTATLPQTISASGARYASEGDAFVFWTKGNSVTIYENGVEAGYVGCVAVAPEKPGVGLKSVYIDPAGGFTLRLPNLGTTTDAYRVDVTHTRQTGDDKKTTGVKFSIPSSMATGTNLSADSYISVEQLNASTCAAAIFSETASTTTSIVDAGTQYSVVNEVSAGAGNRYNETIYALPETTPCTAVRYVIHSMAIENYPAGTVKEFNLVALTAQFDQIRQSLVVR